VQFRQLSLFNAACVAYAERHLSLASWRINQMTMELLPETSAIRTAFAREVIDSGGTMTDVFDDGQRLFLRSTFPGPRDVRPGDGTRRGVALRTRDDEILVHPYLWRQVCRNGAIVARAMGTRTLERFEFATRPEAEQAVLAEVREVVRDCADEHVLDDAVDRMRVMADANADAALSLLPAVLNLPGPEAARWFDAIQGRYRRGADRTMYGLMNAITSVARDTADPDARWRLEEVGGRMLTVLSPARKPPTVKRFPAHAAPPPALSSRSAGDRP
jgi:hypothetical protein